MREGDGETEGEASADLKFEISDFRDGEEQGSEADRTYGSDRTDRTDEDRAASRSGVLELGSGRFGGRPSRDKGTPTGMSVARRGVAS